MYLCYVDEAGDGTELKKSDADVQPIHILAGLVIAAHDISLITQCLLELKLKIYPSRLPKDSNPLDFIKIEIKGEDLRKDLIGSSKTKKKQASQYCNGLFRILKQHHVKLIGLVRVKGVGKKFDETAVYTTGLQYISRWFNQHLVGLNQEQGLIIADMRSKTKNVNLAHSIFTQKFKKSGDQYSKIIDLPVFGNSENHAMIQIADAIMSGLLFPITSSTYCYGQLTSQYTMKSFDLIKQWYSKKIRPMRIRHQNDSGGWDFSLSLDNHLNQKTVLEMLR